MSVLLDDCGKKIYIDQLKFKEFGKTSKEC